MKRALLASLARPAGSRLVLAGSLIGGLSLWACGGEDAAGPGQQQAPPPTVASVAVTPSTGTLVSLGETAQLNASAQDASGNSISGKTFTWSSSDANIATVGTSGQVTAVANGSVTITATTDGVNGTASILVGQVATQLVFTVQPLGTGTKARAPITPPVEVAIGDALGNTVADATDGVTVAIGTNPSGAMLSGATTVNAVNGVATYADLRIDKAGTLYTLVATSGSLPPATSSTFNLAVTLSGFGAATIDGIFSPGEWDDAGSVDFLANLPPNDGGGTTTATLLVMNDASNLYLALKIARSSFGGATNPSFSFDNDNDGVREEGDNGFGMAVGIFQAPELRDIFWTFQPPCPVGAVCGLLDVDHGGTNDGTTAATNDGSFTYIEISFPLDSPDDAHDFSLAPGDIVGFTLGLRLFSLDTACNFGSNCLADTDFPAPSSAPIRFGGIQVASSP